MVFPSKFFVVIKGHPVWAISINSFT